MGTPIAAAAPAAPIVIGLLIAAAIAFAVQRAMRDRWDLILEHSRDLIRHALAALLMLGTLAGTVWTFSNGRLSIAGIWESVVSVGGIAGALELGVIYAGWYIGQLDQRIVSTRRADMRQEMREQRASLIKWFWVIALISGIANLIYRSQALHNIILAAFVSAAPALLTYLFLIKLRPLPRDYAEIGRQGTQRGLVLLATQAQQVMLRSLRKMGAGHTLSEAERAQLAMALSFQRAYVTGEQAQALDQVIAAQTANAPQLAAPAQGAAAGAGGEWLGSADLQRLYGISERAAQGWVGQTPGRRKRPHSNAWEAPASAIYAAHGVPQLDPSGQAASGSRRSRKRSEPQSAAAEPQITAIDPQSIVDAAPISAANLQLAVHLAQPGEAEPPQEV